MMAESFRALVFGSLAAAALPTSAAPIAPSMQAGAVRVLSAPKLETAPRIDGRLDEPMWQQAAVARDFVQLEPRGGEPATQLSEVRIFYTERLLVIGARFRDSEAQRIVGTEYQRDADLAANDNFEILIDTFHDRRNAFYFATNPVGAQRDGLVRNEGDALNFEWDAVWYVACARDDQGWTAEVGIPFSTLRFRPNSSDGWAINFGRLVARTREQSYWAPINRDWGFNARWRVSAFGELAGITGVRPGGRLQLKPFIVAGGDRDFEEDEPRESALTREVGLDAKVRIGDTLVADLTVNTDFAQVEADQQQVNLTRFPLFFPEKREFFLENAGLFQFGERLQPFEPPTTILFFSRRIGIADSGELVPIVGGARLTGKVGRYDIGALDIVTDAVQVDEETHVPRTNFAAVRVKRDILARSSVGGIFLSKSPADQGPSNQVVGADVNIAFTGNATLSAFAAKSFTPGLTGSAHAVGVDGGFQTDRLFLYGQYVDIGDDFNAEMGFLQRTGVRKYRGNAAIGRRPEQLGIRQVFLGGQHIYVTDREGRLQSQLNVAGPFVLFNNGATLLGAWLNAAEGLTEPFEIRDGVMIPKATYRFNQTFLQYESDRARTVSGRVLYNGGGFFNGSLHSLDVSGRVRPHGRLMLELQYLRNKIDLPLRDGRFTTNLVVGRAVLAFSPRAFLRALVQMNDDEREARSNVLFRYTYRPGADLFVVYNEDRGIRGELPRVKRRQFLVKLAVYATR